jgi:hypothetical protein
MHWMWWCRIYQLLICYINFKFITVDLLHQSPIYQLLICYKNLQFISCWPVTSISNLSALDLLHQSPIYDPHYVLYISVFQYHFCEISGFCHGLFTAFTLLGCDAAWIGSWLPAFEDNILVASSRMRQSKKKAFCLDWIFEVIDLKCWWPSTYLHCISSQKNAGPPHFYWDAISTVVLCAEHTDMANHMLINNLM